MSMPIKLRRIFVSGSLLNSGKSLRATSGLVGIRNSATIVEERKINVDGVGINYLKTGNGSHPVLLLPGALGTGWTDFKPQIDGLDKSKMTLVAWDPPGCGKSRPPDRTFPKNYHKRDAIQAHGLMKALGFDEFSLIGWSDGGITSLVLAADYPNSVRRMVTISAHAYITSSEIKMYESIRNIDSWTEQQKARLVDVYGVDYSRRTWTAWVDAMAEIVRNDDGDVCKNRVTEIRCPSLIVHGAKDVISDPEHAKYLTKHIPNSRRKVFENAAHNLHLRYPKEFNELVTTFLLK